MAKTQKKQKIVKKMAKTAEKPKKQGGPSKVAQKGQSAAEAPKAAGIIKKRAKWGPTPPMRPSTQPVQKEVSKSPPPILVKPPKERKARGEGGSRNNGKNCREVACDQSISNSGYCRLHYIKNWKKIKRKELILKEKKLNRYIEELVAKYPDKYIEAIREDLANDKEFSKVVTELELEEGVEEYGEGENIESLIENIRRDIDEDADF